ncbi:MAG: peptide ABC transporter substrate-binding protein [Lachnospiraceae bacterium]|nr:peptide ABC transporter substrate-binding protein [Lachnospiraceae bacterium]
MKKRIIALVLTAVMAASLVACGSTPASSSDNTQAPAASESSNTDNEATAEPLENVDGKILSVQVGPDPETIDPALNSAVDGGNMILHNFECLLTVAQDGSLAPGQAETYDVTEDGLTWTFHLRDGLKWSDGSDLTANDFVYSWRRVCDPNTAAPYAETVLGMVEGFDEAINGNLEALGVTALDDKTLEVKLANVCPYFGSLAAFATLSPVQSATIEANGDAWAIDPSTYVSNGPFYVSEWVPGSYILMKKNPYYWNKDAIKLGGIMWNLIEDSNAAYSAYQTGDVLMIKDVPTEEIPSLVGNSEFSIEPIIGTYYVSVNTSKAPFDNSLLRQALSLAIDREYVAGTIMQGTYTAATNFMGPGWSDPKGGDFLENANGGKPYIDNSDYDANLAKAKELLAEAGYPDGEGLPTLTYTTNDAGYHKAVAEYLQQAWAEIGITLEVNVVEWASFTPMRRSGDYEIARNGWVGDYADPSNMIELLYSSNGNNDGKYNNPEFDAAIDVSRTTLDTTERSAALHQAEDILMADAGCIPVAYYSDFWLQSPKITGSWHSAYGYWYFMFADIAD